MSDEVQIVVTFCMRGGFGPASDYRLKLVVAELPQQFVDNMGARCHPNMPNLLVIGTPEHLAVVNLTFVQHMDVATVAYLKEQAAQRGSGQEREQLELTRA